jgi:hypothetical protein
MRIRHRFSANWEKGRSHVIEQMNSDLPPCIIRPFGLLEPPLQSQFALHPALQASIKLYVRAIQSAPSPWLMASSLHQVW